jgi:hypothetical protein
VQVIRDIIPEILTFGGSLSSGYFTGLCGGDNVFGGGRVFLSRQRPLLLRISLALASESINPTTFISPPHFWHLRGSTSRMLMSYNFKSCNQDQLMLLPLDIRDWVDSKHLVLFVIDAMKQIDISDFYEKYRTDGKGNTCLHLLHWREIEPSYRKAL